MVEFDSQKLKNLKFLSVLSDTTIIYKDEKTNKKYVLKTIDESLLNEYESISKINSPYVAKILYIEKATGEITVVREHVEGQSLDEFLSHGTLSEDDAYKIILQILNGLKSMHKKGLVHRDINPNNIIIDKQKNVKIIDYGIVRKIKDGKTKDTTILGTVGYAAPEQFGFTQSDFRTDMYAVGVLANVMLTKNLPSQELAKGKLRRFIKKCVKIDPQKRYKNTNEAIKYLENKNRNVVLKIIKAIPGFRGRNPIVPIIASLWYAFCVFITLIDITTLKTHPVSVLLAIIYWSFIFILPTLMVSNFLNIHNKLPLTRNLHKALQIIVYIGFSLASIVIGLLLIALTENLFTI